LSRWKQGAQVKRAVLFSATGGLTGTFTTQWSYNLAGLVETMRYPGDHLGGLGEVITYTYHNQKALNAVFGTDTYVRGTSYDAAGRITWRGLGADNNYDLQTAFAYNAWSVDGGRLASLRSGTGSDPVSLQNLVYDYDPNGNINTILDYHAGSPQTQAFEYDSLDRLVSAQASQVGDGSNYSESYTYSSSTGNLASKTGIGNYTYDANHPHAVESTSNGWSFEYDQNGNMITRDLITDTYTLEYDAENRMVAAEWGAYEANFRCLEI